MSYNFLQPIQIISAGDMSGSITSPVIETKLQDNLGIQLNWTGAPFGTFDVQISIDYKKDVNGSVQNPGNWVSLVLIPAIAASGVPDIAYIDINQICAPYMRVLYTRGSGSGSLDMYVTGKGV